MIRALLRAPKGAEIAADVIRLLSVAGVIVAAIGWGPKDAVSIGGAALATLIPRMLGVRPAVDIAATVVITVAAWSAVLDIYHTMKWWDLPMHFSLNGLLAVCALLLLIRLDLIANPLEMPRPVATGTVIATAVGMALGVMWEFCEWFVKVYIDPETLVGYEDTLGDLAAGGLGSLAAGLAIKFILRGFPADSDLTASASPARMTPVTRSRARHG
ncbi:hypothetical protein [Ruicaihuangia caeni]|uniref:hypothetical protein n=1 Tax=Ruicaihuangia caeni TaxID=3042517 RepID=UPI0033905BC7